MLALISSGADAAEPKCSEAHTVRECVDRLEGGKVCIWCPTSPHNNNSNNSNNSNNANRNGACKVRNDGDLKSGKCFYPVPHCSQSTQDLCKFSKAVDDKNIACKWCVSTSISKCLNLNIDPGRTYTCDPSK